MSGYLEHGQWRDGWYDTRATQGEFVRTTSVFRLWISSDGSSAFPAEAGRPIATVPTDTIVGRQAGGRRPPARGKKRRGTSLLASRPNALITNGSRGAT
jgi:hypothetical protein